MHGTRNFETREAFFIQMKISEMPQIPQKNHKSAQHARSSLEFRNGIFLVASLRHKRSGRET
jgi:hypothetical protein